MTESVLSLKEKKPQHWSSFVQNFYLVLNYFMTDALNIIFDDFGKTKESYVSGDVVGAAVYDKGCREG